MNNNQILKSIIDLVNNMKRTKPIVECLTNRVTINDCANMLLAMGASPIMAEIECEMAEIMGVSSALVLNLGLLDEPYLAAMKAAAKAAKEQGKPIILDPVGAGASKLRDSVCAEMIELARPDIIRGNMSEIRALCGASVSSRGVDASSDDAVTESSKAKFGELVKSFAQKTGSVVCATGAIDIIAAPDGRVCYIKNGHEMLCGVTGTGCMCSAMTGAMAAAGDPFTAAAAAVVMLGIAGEQAHEYASENESGIGTFKVKLFDYIYLMSDEDFIKRAKIEEDRLI